MGDLNFEALFTAEGLISLVTLALLEIVLGIDEGPKIVKNILTDLK